MKLLKLLGGFIVLILALIGIYALVVILPNSDDVGPITSSIELNTLNKQINNIDLKPQQTYEQNEVLKKQKEKIVALKSEYEKLYSSLGKLDVGYRSIVDVVKFLKKEGVTAIDDEQSKKLSSRKDQLAIFLSYLKQNGETEESESARLNKLEIFLANPNNYNQLSGEQQAVLTTLEENYSSVRHLIGNLNLISEINERMNN